VGGGMYTRFKIENNKMQKDIIVGLSTP